MESLKGKQACLIRRWNIAEKVVPLFTNYPFPTWVSQKHDLVDAFFAREAIEFVS